MQTNVVSNLLNPVMSDLNKIISIGTGSQSNSPAVSKLRKLMDDVEAIKAEREVIENELKNANFDMREEFLRALAADNAINEPALSTEKLGYVFKDLQKQVPKQI